MEPAASRLVDEGAAAARRVPALHAAQPHLLLRVLLYAALHCIRRPRHVRGRQTRGRGRRLVLGRLVLGREGHAEVDPELVVPLEGARVAVVRDGRHGVDAGALVPLERLGPVVAPLLAAAAAAPAAASATAAAVSAPPRQVHGAEHRVALAAVAAAAHTATVDAVEPHLVQVLVRVRVHVRADLLERIVRLGLPRERARLLLLPVFPKALGEGEGGLGRGVVVARRRGRVRRGRDGAAVRVRVGARGGRQVDVRLVEGRLLVVPLVGEVRVAVVVGLAGARVVPLQVRQPRRPQAQGRQVPPRGLQGRQGQRQRGLAASAAAATATAAAAAAAAAAEV